MTSTFPDTIRADESGAPATRSQGRAAFATDRGHVLPVAADRDSAPPPDLGHVLPVTADGPASFAAGLAGFVGSEFVSSALLMRRLPTFSCDLALALNSHSCETTIAC